ncbi:MAG TPA: DUF4339 domain-containing protein [Chthoniobacter sp.]|nr:DUF4339 domain-containing protein [Chthoniobacter sp.]
MNIYLVRDGEKVGPFSDNALRAMLEQGEVEADDLACRKGDDTWEPLGVVLDKVDAASPEPPPPAPAPEPATAAQIAFLSYFGADIPAGLDKEAAEKLITQASEDPKKAKQLAKWNVERLQLHPELFVVEVQAKKENRALFYFDLCLAVGSDYFTGVTKAHCQVLVAFLDVKFPRWDANDADATEKYFFPAISEKFPQLVNKAWKGRFHYGHSPSAPGGAKATRKSPTSKLAQKPDSAIGAIFRGIVLGLCILGLLFGVYYAMHRGKMQMPTPPPHGESGQ